MESLAARDLPYDSTQKKNALVVENDIVHRMSEPFWISFNTPIGLAKFTTEYRDVYNVLCKINFNSINNYQKLNIISKKT